MVNPENTFFSVKRFIGRKMSEVKDESQQVPYRLADSAGAVKIKSSNAGKDFSPEEISAQVLRKLVDDAAKFLNDKVRQYQPTAPGGTLQYATIWLQLSFSNVVCALGARHCSGLL